MIRPLLITALVALSLPAPALAKSDRLVRVCNERGSCTRVSQATVRRALAGAAGQSPATSEATASAASNRRQLNALLARLR